jgi:hypothetical protein
VASAFSDNRSRLKALAKLDPRQSRIVELRFFGGLTIEETAGELNLSPATIKREWDAYLDRACSNDHSLRREVESLLDSGDDIRLSFLQSPPLSGSPTNEGRTNSPYQNISDKLLPVSHIKGIQDNYCIFSYLS